MHLNKKHLFSLAAMGVALGLAASNAGAQQATFTLPFQARVNNVTLQPGHYRLTAPSASSPLPAIYLYGDDKVSAILPQSVDIQDVSDRSYLELVNVGGTYFVQKYTSGLTGKTYTFAIPKSAQREILANTRATTVVVTGGAAN